MQRVGAYPAWGQRVDQRRPERGIPRVKELLVQPIWKATGIKAIWGRLRRFCHVDWMYQPRFEFKCAADMVDMGMRRLPDQRFARLRAQCLDHRALRRLTEPHLNPIFSANIYLILGSKFRSGDRPRHG